MMSERTARRPKRRWPRGARESVLPNGVVTYVTNADVAKLEQIVAREEKALSPVEYEILSRCLRARLWIEEPPGFARQPWRHMELERIRAVVQNRRRAR